MNFCAPSRLRRRLLALAASTTIASAVLFCGLPVANAAEPAVDPASETLVEPEAIEMANAALADQPQLRVDGRVSIVVIEGSESTHRYSVSTDAGTSVFIEGDLPASVTSGSRFVGDVAVPPSVIDVVGDRFSAQVERSAEHPIDADSEVGAAIIAAAGPLQIVDATIQPPVDSVTVPMAHTINVAILDGTNFSDSEVAGVVAGLNSFWSAQSAGLIPGITRAGAIQRYDSPLIRAGACGDIFKIWDEAAKRFGKSVASDYYGWAGQHLLVIQPPGCGSGVATIGFGVHEGGVILADVSNVVDLHIVAHEFGHNIGLGHSNTLVCSGSTRVDGSSADGCAEYEYQDYYDVMAGGFTSCSPCISTNKLAALNATQKKVLGFFPAGSMQAVTVSSTQVVNAASATSGLRALRVQDPISKETYYVEYRSGTGGDASTFYTLAPASLPSLKASLGIGVRVLKLRPAVNGVPYSVAFAEPPVPGHPKRSLALGAGQSFATSTGGLTITVRATSSTTATVELTVLTLPTTIDRISGADRYDVAVKISQRAFPTLAPVVYLATGEKYPDALSAAAAALKQGGPLLLTNRKTLPAVVRAEIVRLKPKTIVVVGGEASISQTVYNELVALDLDGLPPKVVRVGGANRYAASAAIVDYAFDSAPTAYVVTGANFPDALSAAAAGASKSAPVLLVDGSKATVGSIATKLLTDLKVTEVKIGGGTNSVSRAIETSLDASFGAVKRLSGADRFAAARAINADGFVQSGTVYLATGLNYPDALAGAVIAGRSAAPLYLTSTTCVPRGVLVDISRLGATKATLLGGPSSLSAAVLTLTPCSF